jgi:(2R)-3-sulfolactate dehydrogenase (NADP+)
MAVDVLTLAAAEARDLAISACVGAGASPNVAASLVDATLSAATAGREGMGFPHLLDHLHALREGRIDGHAEPLIEHVLPAVIAADARGGIAQRGFDLAYGDLAGQARASGIALFSQKNSYTSGELGYFVRRLALDGLVALAATNGPALMAAAPGSPRVFCTNPIAFGAPTSDGPIVIDQASSATAFVNIVRAASKGETIPEGWATDESGDMTTDAARALRGALLPFGGYKAANIALMVEVLAAGLSGAAWSLDAKDFRSGDECPAIGLTVIAIAPAAIDADFAARLGAHRRRLAELGVHVPGGRATSAAGDETPVRIGRDDLEALRSFARG